MRRVGPYLILHLDAFVCSSRLDAHSLGSTPEFNVKEHYTKYEFRIPMRDGKLLFTRFTFPRILRAAIRSWSTARPTVWLLTASINTERRSDPPTSFSALAIFSFIKMCADVTCRKEHLWRCGRTSRSRRSKDDVDDSSDMYDTVDWLLRNIPNNNGKVGIWGISYPGFYTSASIIDSHPAIKAASPEAPMTDLFMGDDAYHGGAFMLAANFGFYTFFRPQPAPILPQKNSQRFDYGTADGYDFFLRMGSLSDAKALYFKDPNWLWDDQVAHDTYDDYWKVRNLAPHMKNIHCAVLTVGGWFDAEDLQGPFSTHAAIGRNNPEIYNGIVVGPWVHGGWSRYDGNHLGSVNFASNTGQYFRSQILFPFFEQYLKGGADAKLPAAFVFETGTNTWREYSNLAAEEY